MPEPPSDSVSKRTLEMAHVLFMDLVAYSQLPMDEQTRLIEKLQQIVRNTTEFSRAQKRRQLLRLPTGDGMALVFFGDAEAAVRCALEISRALQEVPELKLRMGIHAGPVQRVEDINANRNVAGGGINIAQRVMDCGDAGHILISKSVADVLDQVSTWKAALHDLGEAEVKHAVRVHLYNLYTEEAGNPELPQKLRTVQTTAATARSRSKRKKLSLGAVATGVIVALAAGGFISYRHAHQPKLTDKDTIVLADFTNTTGDVVFDGTLRQGLEVQLEQSPFLSLVSEQRIQQTLSLMSQPPDAKLTPKIAWGVCQRTGGAAVLTGSIAQIGAQYLLTLKAVNCTNGESLTSTEAQARDKNHVLDALGKIASEIRTKLGESINSIQKFDTPLEQASTPSIEALQAYSLGRNMMTKDNSDPIPHLLRAIKLDPNFAMAYATVGYRYNGSDKALSDQYLGKAYELRERVSEREKFYIEGHYSDTVTGDLEKARLVFELWAQTYPRDVMPRVNLAKYIYPHLGRYELSLDESQQIVRLTNEWDWNDILVDAYINLNRFDEARNWAHEVEAKTPDNPRLRSSLYTLAFLLNDKAGIEDQVRWAAGKGLEGWYLRLESNSASYFGQLRKARQLSRGALLLAEHAEKKQAAAHDEAVVALREALFGNVVEARLAAATALGLSTDRDAQGGGALALALAGDTSRAQALSDDLTKRFPEDTRVQFNYLPSLNAQIALARNNPSKAIEALQAAAPYELGNVDDSDLFLALYPVHVRGQAYLAAHQGDKAAIEFQKILDHPGIVGNKTIGALARLGLARAYVLQGNSTQALAAYKDFLTLWKDADPDIPILKQAKAEYAKLQ